jgi:hypothetical protein
MAQSARVTSLHALEALKAALCRFASAAQNALAGVDTELSHVAEWLEQQTASWRKEVLRREELVVRAKGDLTLKKYTAGRGGFRGSTEQELALAKAQTALKHAHEKQEACRRWARILPRELEECRAPAGQLACMLDADLRQAVAYLEQKLLALEGYLAVTVATPPPPGVGRESRPEP